jgi:crotonobetaine/carnitine-CoA ligase
MAGSGFHLPGGVVAEFETLPQLLAARAGTHGELPAFTIDHRTISYAELDREAAAFAAGLAATGVAKGDRVGALLYNSLEGLVLLFACARIGAIFAPMNVALVGDDLAYTLGDTGARVVVTDSEGWSKLAALPREWLVGLQLFSTAAEPVLPLRPFAALRSSEAPPPLDVGPGDACCIIYTGGTTGMPKGVVLSHFYQIVSAYRWTAMLQLTNKDRHYSVLQLFHVGAQTNAIMAPLLNGFHSTLDRWFSLRNFWRRVRESEATILDPMGSMFTLLVQQPKGPDDRDHRARAAWGATAMLPPEVAETFTRRFGIELVPCFGGTEIGGSIVVGSGVGESRRDGANGRIGDWCDLRIVDALDRPVPAGTVGEIVARPTIPFSMMSRYHNNAERTLACWRNLWFHTGDLGRLDEDGYLYFVGRQAHWLRRRSENISAYEVERAIADCPSVREVVVVGVPSELGEDEVKAFIVGEPGLTPERVIEWCDGRIAPFKIPRFIEFVETLPRSAAKQEIERHKLKALPNDAAWDREKQTDACRAEPSKVERA